MVTRLSIKRFSLAAMMIVSWLPILVLGGVWAGDIFSHFQQEVSSLQRKYFDSRKELVRDQVLHVLDIVQEERESALAQLRQHARNRVSEATLLIASFEQTQSYVSQMHMLHSLARIFQAHDTGKQGLFRAFQADQNTLVLLNPAPKGLVVEALLEKLKGIPAGERQIALTMHNNHTANFWVHISDCPERGIRIVSGGNLELIEKETQLFVAQQLEKITFGESGYIFGGAWDGSSTVGPAKGRNMWNVRDANGVLVVQELIAAAQHGGGFVSYVMPKSVAKKSKKKISFVMPIKDWEWYVGAGMYVDDIESLIRAKKKALERALVQQTGLIGVALLSVILLSFIISRFFASSLQKRIRAFGVFCSDAFTHGSQISEEEIRFDELRLLASSVNSMIEERQKVQERLAVIVARYRTLVGSLPGVVFQVDPDQSRTVRFISEAVNDVVGYPVHEFMGGERSLLSIVDKQDREWVNSVVQESLESKKPYTMEYRYQLSDGSLRWALERGQVRYDDTGEPVAVDGVILDLTDKRLAEEEHYGHMHFLETMDRVDRDIRRNDDLNIMLQSVLATLRKAFEADRCWIIHPCRLEVDNYRFVAENTLPDFTRDIGGTIPMNTEAAKLFAAALEFHSPLILGPGEKHDVSVEFSHKHDVKSQMVVVLHPRSGAPWLLGLDQCKIAREWTEKESRLFNEVARRVSDAVSHALVFQKLRENDDQFRLLLEQTVFGLGILQDDVIKYANRAFCEVFGLSVEKILSLEIGEYWEFVHPDDRDGLRSAIRQSSHEEHSLSVSTWRVITAGGHVRQVEMYSKGVTLQGRFAVLLSLHDVTDIQDLSRVFSH